VIGGIGHYSAYFSTVNNENSKLYGKVIDKMDKACKILIKAHKIVNEQYDWCPGIGWDFMIDDQDELIFFEGNQASHRLPRIIFLDYNNMMDFIKDFFWPFDEKHSV